MRLIKSTDNFSCGLASLAMLLDADVDDLILELGHNGGELAWPDDTEPECFRGFSNQEFIDLCLRRNIALIEIIAQPQIYNYRMVPKPIMTLEESDQRIQSYMTGNQGIIVGMLESGARHAVAWDGERVYDPVGFVYRFESSDPDVRETDKDFYPIVVAEFLMAKELK